MDQSHPQSIKIGGEPYAVPSRKDCEEVSRACDAFWLKRGIKPPYTGFDFFNFKNEQKNSSTPVEKSEESDDEALKDD